MKIVAISDTHNQHDQIIIPECDILIHAGDATYEGSYRECMSFLFWMQGQNQCKHKIFVPGNHDFYFQKSDYIQNIPSGITVLIDKAITIEGIKIYGTPWSPFFYDWAFNGLELRNQGYNYKGGPGPCSPDDKHPLLSEKFNMIPDDTNIVICHGPPRIGKLDLVERTQEYVGSTELLKNIRRLPNFIAGFYGHIHSGYGSIKDKTGTHYNVSVCTEKYKPTNPVTIIEI